jgi:serine-type D-Ala-D-Ala carboxypeptidase/endopeptidase (penicillin-binding protein 4)
MRKELRGLPGKGLGEQADPCRARVKGEKVSKRYNRSLISVVLFCLYFLPVRPLGAESRLDALNQRVDAILRRYHQDPSNWGILFRSLSRGDELISRNALHGYMPASNLKLLVTAVALDGLGPDFRYRTTVVADGAFSSADSTLNGDLVLRGSGDPTLSDRFFSSRSSAWDEMARQVAASGIRHVTGALVADNTLFEAPFLANGWPWEDLMWWYAAPVSALSFNDNTVDLEVFPATRAGEPPSLRITPAGSGLQVINRALTVDNRAEDHLAITRDTPGTAVVLTGGIYKGSLGFLEHVTVDSPARFAASVFAESLARSGVRVDGPIRVLSAPGARPEYLDRSPLIVAQHESAPLKEVVRVINKRSHNFYAEQLLFTVGANLGGGGGFREGIKVEERLLARQGVDLRKLRIEDGSGLSRLNLITPDAFVKLLTYMYTHPAREDYISSLPVSGSDNGVRTMSRTSAEGKINAKTGYIASVMALSGYAHTADGEPLAFSILGNNWLISRTAARMIIRDICVSVSDFRRGWSGDSKAAKP